MNTTGRPVFAAALLAAMFCSPGVLKARDIASPSVAEPSEREPYVVRIGYTTFKSPEAVRSDFTLQSVKSYLDEIAIKSRQEPWKRPLQFELTLGNYYQIWSWFKSGQIDAAIASPFVAMLLERDSQALSVLEFSEGVDAAAHYPIVAATGSWRDKPLEGVNHYLDSLLKAVHQGELESEVVQEEVGKIRGEIRFDLVSHLSSSGFIMPALYAQAWLDRPEQGDLDEAVKGRFWRLFFENANLMLAHGGKPADPSKISTIQFSYRHSDTTSKEPFGSWVPYQAGLFPADAPSIPNDVLLVRRQIADELVGAGAADRATLGEVFLSPDSQKNFRESKGSYKEVRWFNSAVHSRFRQEVNGLFSHEVKDAELARLNIRWFERGLFDFTIDETMAFLRQDQKNSGISRLGVVLSGGGVKSLYQTVLLDHLYGSGSKPVRHLSNRQLRNYDEASPRSAGTVVRDSAEALTVHTIIGTSGGAMLAFFAAQVPQIGSLQKIVEATSQKRLFPRADLPRLLSILVLLIILQAVLLTAKTFNWWSYGVSTSIPIQKSGRRNVLPIALLLIVVGAAAIVTTRSEYMESAPFAEAMFYILTGVIAHFGVTCIVRAEGAPSLLKAALGRFALLGLVFGIQILVVSVALRHWLGPGPEALHKVHLPGLSVLASAGVLLIAGSLATAAAAGRWGLAVQGVRCYAAALTAAAVVTGGAFLPLIVLESAGRGTLLELTALYWSGLLVAAVAASVGLLYLVHAPRAPLLCFLRDGFVELMRDRRGVLTTSMAATIVGLFAFCIACWGLLVAPAVYSNVEAVKAFSESLPEEQLWTGRFRSNLVVTGTLLRPERCSPTRTINEGGLYFCFEGMEGCGTPGGGQWQVFRRPAPARALDAVFASGSAFPVFPPHLAHLPDGCEVRLVDGGYAHNVPLEAAAMAEARQVLILNASPDPLDMEEQPRPRWRRVLRQAQLEGGQLVRSSPDVLSFLFARAQELDRSIGGDLVVASLTPRPKNGWWPFLLDFRPSVQQEMLRAANQDINQERRIGHVLSWGRPVLLP